MRIFLTRRSRIGVLWLLLLAIYLPALGRGFIKDDFGWIAEARERSSLELLTPTGGFYRPIVALSFELDHALFGLTARGYGFTNLLIVLAITLAIASLCRQFGLGGLPSDLAAGIWALNFHGVNMGLLWISGRTSLLVVLFATLAAGAFLARRRVLTTLLILLALGSKEEALLLPFVLAAWHLVLRGRPGAAAAPVAQRVSTLLESTWHLLVPLLAYATARVLSGAMNPWTAPWYYRFTADPLLIARNAVEYLDRGATLAAAVTLVAALMMRTLPARARIRWPVLLCGLIWFAGSYLMTVFLPVRSSLYALLPSVGAALAAGVSIEAMMSLQPRRRATATAAWLVVLILVLVPVYRMRNDRWTRLADLSADVLTTLRSVSADLSPGSRMLLIDDPGSRASLDSAFGVHLQTAGDLFLRDRILLAMEPPPAEVAPAPWREEDVAIRLSLQNGRLTPLRKHE